MVSGLLCIVSAVSARRMRLPWYSPFCRCAIMKCAISSAGEDNEPAGAGPTISNRCGSSECQRIALGHQRRKIRRAASVGGRWSASCRAGRRYACPGSHRTSPPTPAARCSRRARRRNWSKRASSPGRIRARASIASRQLLVPRCLGILGYDVLCLLLKTRDVLHEIAHSHRLTVARRNLEIQVLIDVSVEVDLPQLDLLHHGGPGDQFRHRPRPEQRELGIDRRAFAATSNSRSRAPSRICPSP